MGHFLGPFLGLLGKARQRSGIYFANFFSKKIFSEIFFIFRRGLRKWVGQSGLMGPKAELSVKMAIFP